MIQPSADGLTVSVLVANFNYGRFLGELRAGAGRPGSPSAAGRLAT